MGSRVDHVTAALRRLPSQTTLVNVAAVDEGNAVLRATAKASEGDTLLVVPFEMCVTSADLDGHALSERLPVHDSFGRLLLALLVLLHDRPDDPRSVYLTNIVPPDHFAKSMMACWPESGAVARWLANSVAWHRARAMLLEVERECAALAQAGFSTSRERLLWAKLLVKTRALDTRGDAGHVICPVFDMANHSTNIPTARVRLTNDAVRVEALQPLDPGDEVTWCYDPDADYLDLFERYGFFDKSSIIHTAEVVVPRNVLAGENEQPWRCALVEKQADIGCDRDFDAWWVPDYRIEASPLYVAVRASLVTEAELFSKGDDGVDGSALQQPILEEAAVRARLAELLEDHLSSYSTSLPSDAVELAAAQNRGSDVQIAALQLLIFEKALLQKQVKALRLASDVAVDVQLQGPQQLHAGDERGPVQKIRRCVIAPGNGCASVRESNWYGWLYQQLTQRNIFDEVICRDFPDPYGAKRSVWLPFLRDELKVGPDTVLVGHSSGAEAAMRLAAETPVGGLVLVSACHSDLGHDGERASGYYPPSGGAWDWDAIRGNAGWIVQFHSRDDPLVPVEEGRVVAKGLRSEYHELNGFSHFFDPFGQLVDVLLAKCKAP